MHGSRHVFGRAGTVRGLDDREDEHGAARLRYVDDPRYGAERLLARRVIALGRDEVRVLELERFRSANVDRTHHRSRRPRELERAQPSDTRGLARTKRSDRVHDARTCVERERPWCVGLERLSSRSCLVARTARDSLVGIAPGGVRARGLGKSQGRERAVVDTTKGCPDRGCVPLNQGRPLRSWLRG